MAKILIVEDDFSTITFLQPELQHEGYEVCTAQTGKKALEVFENENPDLILLDIMLPEMNGIEVLRRIRKTSKIPVILVTARGETLDKVNGLNAGADDYISKPFEIEELLARVSAVLRRFENASEFSANNLQKTKNGEIEIFSKNMTATVNKNQISLSKTEFLLLKLFIENQNEILDRNRIIDEVWGNDHIIEPNAIDVYLNYLKNKIKKFSDHEYFSNKRGVGFIMETFSGDSENK